MRQVPKNSVQIFQTNKSAKRATTMVTGYDYPSAQTIADTGVDAILVGDSLAMVVHGHDSTIHATMPMMELHVNAVARGIGRQCLIADLPFLSYRGSLEQTVENAGRLLQAGAQAVKLEGGDARACKHIETLVEAGIPVMGHLGLTPQCVHQLGGYKVQGKTTRAAQKILEQANALELAGCMALVLECVPETLAHAVTQQASIATIGIGAGARTDGQILVWHDLLGLQDNLKPKFVHRYLEGKSILQEAINAFVDAVNQGRFPSEAHAY